MSARYFIEPMWVIDGWGFRIVDDEAGEVISGLRSITVEGARRRAVVEALEPISKPGFRPLKLKPTGVGELVVLRYSLAAGTYRERAFTGPL